MLLQAQAEAESNVVPTMHEANKEGDVDASAGDMTKPPIAVDAINAVNLHLES